jgi:hypothetical protein
MGLGTVLRKLSAFLIVLEPSGVDRREGNFAIIFEEKMA